MSDKGWMLNPEAIQQARTCINIIQQELGIKLKLSHPEFLSMIKEYIDLTDSNELKDAYLTLRKYATGEAIRPVKKTIIPIKEDVSLPATNHQADEEMIEYKGKTYPKYCEGKAFKGLYRGQARYG